MCVAPLDLRDNNVQYCYECGFCVHVRMNVVWVQELLGVDSSVGRERKQKSGDSGEDTLSWERYWRTWMLACVC